MPYCALSDAGIKKFLLVLALDSYCLKTVYTFRIEQLSACDVNKRKKFEPAVFALPAAFRSLALRLFSQLNNGPDLHLLASTAGENQVSFMAFLSFGKLVWVTNFANCKYIDRFSDRKVYFWPFDS